MSARKIIVLAVTLVALALVLELACPFLPVKKRNVWTCAYTGSQKGNTVWLGFLTTGKYYGKSPIERWLESRDKVATHKWVRTMGTGYGIFGSVSREHEQAPAIYHLPPQLQEQFIETATEDEIARFLKVLTNGSPEEQEKAIGELSDKMFKMLEDM